MKIRVKLILVLVVSIIPTIIAGVVLDFQIRSMTRPLMEEIPKNLEMLAQTEKLDNLISSIRYFDEVLTQSARNYAFTGDKKWDRRYRDAVPQLDAAIKEAIAEGDSGDKELFLKISASNLVLVGMEESALKLTDEGKLREAVGILDGEEYARQKEIYSKGMEGYVIHNQEDQKEARKVSLESLELLVVNSQSQISASYGVMTGVVVLGIVATLVLGGLFLTTLSGSIVRLRNTVKKIEEGDLTVRANIESKDEIGDLARAFDRTMDKLRESRETVEQKVAERTTQLEQMNRLMVGRELKMVELKKQIEQLEGKRE